MDRRAYWVWLQQAFGPGSRKPARLASQYAGGVQEFCQGGPKLWNSRRDLTDREAAALRDFSVSQAEARLEYAQKVGWTVLTPDCEGYPELLKNISDPPAALYIKGKLPDLDRTLSIGIAGSRDAKPFCLDAARKIGYQLAAGGACVVSGGAVGIDAAALTGALGIPGSVPVSVLPVSLDSTYIAKNAKLRAMIFSHGGALVSEHFSLNRPERGDFPVRNRLVTGLSRGILLIQAARRSGTMIYASHAADQNRDVFVYPGPEDSSEFAGSRDLIEDGAKVVACGEDILTEYGERPPARPGPRFPELFSELSFQSAQAPQRVAAVEGSGRAPVLDDVGKRVSPQALQVWKALGRDPMSVASLAEATGLPASVLLGLLTELELEGLAESLPGKRYIRSA